jgi:PAS domain S-box-containing protein
MQNKSIQTLNRQLFEARQTIADLRMEINNYKCFAENVHDGLLISDASGRIRYVNNKLCALSGRNESETLNLHIKTLIPPDELAKVVSILPKGRSIFNAPNKLHTFIQNKRGDLIPVVMAATKTLWDSKAADLFIFNDISETMSRQRNEAVITAMIETTDNLIAALDIESQTVYANGAFRRFYFQLYGTDLKSYDSIMTSLPSGKKKFWCNIIEETKTTGSRRFDQQYFLQNGRYDIEWSTSRINDTDGSTIGVSFFGRDITHRRKAEEKLRERDAQLHHAQKLEAIGTLAGGVAHEFNNALSIVLGNLELAAMDINTEHPVRPYIDDAKFGILRAKKVVRQLQDLGSKSDGQPQKVDMHVITANALSLLRASIPSHIEFHQLINECPPIMADPSHIHQLIVNLCTNSAEAMEQDGGVLTVTLDPVHLTPGKIPKNATLAPGAFAKLTVADTGKGIEDDVLDRIYEPFFTTKGPDRGTGLGLAVVHGIVKSCAGEIIAGRVPDRGAKFEVYFPTISPAKPGEQQPPPEPSSLKGNERIMIVDDEPKFVMITQQQLEHFGYRVDIFTSALRALERFTAFPEDYDLVISDVAMPKMTGDKFVHQIRLIRPEIPVILCTGYSDKVDQKTAALMDCEYVIKPVERNQLTQLIRKSLDKQINSGAAWDGP